MSHILITGDSSYIGGSFLTYLRENTAHTADGISLRGHAWRELSFAPYDTVFHAVGLTHVKESAENAPQYYEVNRDLTMEVARKAFCSLSYEGTGSVFGQSACTDSSRRLLFVGSVRFFLFRLWRGKF